MPLFNSVKYRLEVPQSYTSFFPLKKPPTNQLFTNSRSFQSKSECPNLSHHGLVFQTDDNTTAIQEDILTFLTDY